MSRFISCCLFFFALWTTNMFMHLFYASFPVSLSTLLIGLCLFLRLYNHFLPQKFVLQCSHWNLLIPSQLGGGTETSESVGEESDSIVAWESWLYWSWSWRPGTGDGWPLETLFSEEFACGQASGLLLCRGLVRSGRWKAEAFLHSISGQLRTLGPFKVSQKMTGTSLTQGNHTRH